MKKISLSFLLVLWCFVPALAQNTCTCTQYEELRKQDKSDSSLAIRLLRSAAVICQAKGNERMGVFLVHHNQLDSADYFLQKAETLYKQTQCSDSILTKTYSTWAQLYYTKADFAKSQMYSLKYLQSTEAAGNNYEQALANTMIAQLFNQTQQAGKGIGYTRKAVALLPKINDEIKLAHLYSMLSKRYLWHYQDTKTTTSLDSSELFSRRQLAIAHKIKKNSSIAFAYNNLQGIAWEKGDLKKALVLLDSSFIYIATDDYKTLRTNYFDKADILLELKNYTQAKIFADSALYYDNLEGNNAFLADTYQLIAKIAQQSGDFKTAFEMKIRSDKITDSIKNVQKTEAVVELEKKYNQAKNENTIKDLEQKKQLYLFLAILGLLVAVIIGFFLRQQSLKHQRNILEVEQRLNRARMNPHFFFNALTALQKFAIREPNPQAMASNLSKFSNIMRETLESTYKEYVTIEQEMDFLNEYLEVQKIRFPQAFTYEVGANKELEINELQIPSMIIQPFVENSIEHGFAGITYRGNIAVHFKKESDKNLLISIIDNGKGLNLTAKESNQHISRASQIIKDRIYLLNIKLKTKASFSIENNTEAKGVIVKIHLPLLYKEL